jgi:hypothetical protein
MNDASRLTKKGPARAGHNVDEKLLIGRQEAAAVLSISQRALDCLVANKQLQVRRIGSRVLIPVPSCSDSLASITQSDRELKLCRSILRHADCVFIESRRIPPSSRSKIGCGWASRCDHAVQSSQVPGALISISILDRILSLLGLSQRTRVQLIIRVRH